MWVYLESEPGILWTVGHYNPSGEWLPESDHDTPEEAAQRCAWLNGAGCAVGIQSEDDQLLKRILAHLKS